MNLDEPLAKAFETIREVACFDSHSLVPHPENLKFQAIEERRAMRRLSMKLAEIVSNPEGEDLQYAANTVRRHFWKELGLSQPPELGTDLPRFLQQPDHRIEPRTDSKELADQLAAVKLNDTSVLCIVASNLSLLKKLLNLSDTTIKYLTLAYANCSIHSLTKDESSGLKTALTYIGVEDDAHRNRAVAVLLEAPIADVEAIFAPPSMLVALRFVDAQDSNKQRNLRAVFALTDEFLTLLESSYRSHEALLAAILEPEQDLNLLDDGTTPISYLYDILPKDIAEAYKCAVLEEVARFV